jgi:uncharacterized protein YcfJ
MKPRQLLVAVVLPLCVMLTTGCANKTRTGALVGTGVGTGVGAIIGHQIGKGKEGALIGAAVGAVSGSLIGHQEDVQDEQDTVARNVAHQEEQRVAAERAMSNFDVAEMTAKKVTDVIIINTIQDRGGAFDTSPSGIISLKDAGVSDTVIMAMQRHNKSR